MAQIKIASPPTFVLFASRVTPTSLPESYRRYLVNSIRESFELPGVPIRVTVKSNKNPYAEGEEKAGQGSARGACSARSLDDDRPEEGEDAHRRGGQGEVPGLSGKSKTYNGKAKRQEPKAGNPQGRAAKLLRPGVKPKRASRPPSSGRRPR